MQQQDAKPSHLWPESRQSRISFRLPKPKSRVSLLLQSFSLCNVSSVVEDGACHPSQNTRAVEVEGIGARNFGNHRLEAFYLWQNTNQGPTLEIVPRGSCRRGGVYFVSITVLQPAVSPYGREGGGRERETQDNSMIAMRQRWLFFRGFGAVTCL